MKLKRFKEKDNKRIGIILFTITGILLVSGVILYRTFAIFEVKTNQNVIKGNVQDPGDIYFAFYKKNEDTGDYEIQKDMPQKESGYVLDDVNSYCGVNGEKNPSIKVSVNEDWKIIVSGVTTSRTKCNLYFTKGIFIMGHGVPVVEEGDGLYKVEHGEEVTGTVDDVGFRKTEFRYVGKNPNNYITFNDEKWRIIGLVNVQTSVGIEQRIKIVRNEQIGSFVWDKDNKNDWTKSSLMIMLNDGYYNSSSNTLCYRSEGDGANLSIKETICDFSGTNNIKGINTLSKKMIDEDIIWNIGGSTKRDDATLTSFYNDERGKNSYNGQPYEWSKSSPNFHSIGLIYPSDFILATNGGTIGRESCLKAEVYNWFIDDYQNCSSNDWLFYRAWSLTSNFNGPNTVFIYQENVVDSYVQNSWLVHPSLYLKSTLKIHDGIGSLEDSFQIEDYYL